MKKTLFPILLWTALVCLSVATIVQLLPLASLAEYRDDTNLTRVQDYLARTLPPEAVLVGSSQTFRLPPAALSNKIVNLGLLGEGALTGLEVIRNHPEKPRLVLIEINFLERSENNDLVRSMFRFPEFLLRRWLKIFRAGNSPVDIFSQAVFLLAHRGKPEFTPPPDIVDRLVAEQARAMTHLPDNAILQHRLSSLRRAVIALRKEGVAVGFYEMPIDPRLRGRPYPTAIRQLAMAAFPPSQFCWLKPELPAGVHTRDGIHLEIDDATSVAKQFLLQYRTCLSSIGSQVKTATERILSSAIFYRA